MVLHNRVARRGKTARRWGIELLERREMLSAVPPTVVNVEVASSQWSSAFVEFLQENSLGQQGYSIPVGTALQSCSLTWTGIDQIIIHFSEDVRVDAEDLSLSGINSAAYAFRDFHYDVENYVATWTLATPVFIDRLQIDLDGDGIDPVRNLEGIALDGSWVNDSSQYQSGGTTAGIDFQFTFNVLPADINNSGDLAYVDYRFIYQSRGTNPDDPRYIAFRDIDGDGFIDSVDWMLPIDFDGAALPSGVPVGVTNDAPTTEGIGLQQIAVGATDVAISLLYSFDDAEEGASGLTYSIVGSDNPAMLGNSYINPTTKELVLNATPGMSGRSAITIRATDSGGLFVDTEVIVEVGYQNVAPTIQAYAGLLGPHTWMIIGQLTDYDDAPDNFIMELTGEINKRFTVQEDGQFECVVIFSHDLDDYTFYLTTWDPQGAQSNVIQLELYLA
jgi:hypothetical protein